MGISGYETRNLRSKLGSKSSFTACKLRFLADFCLAFGSLARFSSSVKNEKATEQHVNN